MCKRTLEGESGNPSSGPGFAPLTSSACRCSLPPLCRPEAAAVLSASIPQRMLGSPSLQAFARAVPSAWSGLPCSPAQSSFLLMRKHPPPPQAGCTELSLCFHTLGVQSSHHMGL